MTVRDFKPGDQCRVNGYLVTIQRHARRTTYVRTQDERMFGSCTVQLDKTTKASVA